MAAIVAMQEMNPLRRAGRALGVATEFDLRDYYRLGVADTKARLEDIYLPYKPKRRTKAQIDDFASKLSLAI